MGMILSDMHHLRSSVGAIMGRVPSKRLKTFGDLPFRGIIRYWQIRIKLIDFRYQNTIQIYLGAVVSLVKVMRDELVRIGLFIL